MKSPGCRKRIQEINYKVLTILRHLKNMYFISEKYSMFAENTPLVHLMYIHNINLFEKKINTIKMLCNAEKISLKNFHCNFNNFIHKEIYNNYYNNNKNNNNNNNNYNTYFNDI